MRTDDGATRAATGARAAPRGRSCQRLGVSVVGLPVDVHPEAVQGLIRSALHALWPGAMGLTVMRGVEVDVWIDETMER